MLLIACYFQIKHSHQNMWRTCTHAWAQGHKAASIDLNMASEPFKIAQMYVWIMCISHEVNGNGFPSAHPLAISVQDWMNKLMNVKVWIFLSSLDPAVISSSSPSLSPSAATQVCPTPQTLASQHVREPKGHSRTCEPTLVFSAVDPRLATVSGSYITSYKSLFLSWHIPQRALCLCAEMWNKGNEICECVRRRSRVFGSSSCLIVVAAYPAWLVMHALWLLHYGWYMVINCLGHGPRRKSTRF